MAENISIKKMCISCNGLIGTKDITEWEDIFLTSVCEKTLVFGISLSEKQIDALTRIYSKHFA